MKYHYHYLFLLFIFCLNTTTVSGQCPRKTIIDNYNNQYLPSTISNAELEWTGDLDNCTPGTLSETILAKHLQRINYYRALVGGLAPVTLNEEKNQQALAAVLMFEAQNTPAPPIQFPLEISHCTGQNGAPCNTYPCTTPDGIEAAQRGNISYTTTGWDFTDPIDLYMRDDDDFNQLVAHRRWILNSKATDMGIATSPRFNTMHVVDGFFNPSIYENYIAYPPNGYMPQTLVPLRWSFSIPDADFSNAVVTMIGPDENEIPVTISTQNALNFADNTIAWDPSTLITDSNLDLTYTITVSNISGAAQSSYSYESTIVPISYPPLCSNSLVWNEENCQCEEAAPVCPTEPLVISTSPNRCDFQPIEFFVNVESGIFSWEFGDGKFNVTDSPFNRASHVYDDPGNYLVTAFVEYPNGCLDTAYLEMDIISSMADFTYTLDGRTITLIADTTNAANIIRYNWNFGDGNTISGTETTIQHTYETDGNYIVRLEVQGACTSFPMSESISVEEECNDPACLCLNAPFVRANFNYVITSDSILFTDLSTGDITNKQWSFNTPEMVMNDKIALPANGSYDVCLTVADDCDQESTFCQTLTIEKNCTDTPLEIVPIPNNTTCIRMPVSISARGAQVVRFKWTRSNGDIFELANDTPFDIAHDVIHHTEGGSYTVSLEVEYPNGCIEEISYDYEVLSNAVTIEVEELEDGLTYNFTALVDNEDIVQAYTWDINDFPFSFRNGKQITHTFSREGDFFIRAEALVPSCGPNSTSIQVNVVETQAENDPALCVDGIDNDKDGLIDCEDSDCPCTECPTDLLITTQEEIDNFINNFSGCTEITGDLTIRADGYDITNLDGLSALTNVGGNLSIIANYGLTSLNGLHNVSTVGGNLDLDNNIFLTSIRALRIGSIGGHFSLGNNLSLSGQLMGNGLPKLTSIGGSFSITEATELTSLGDLTGVTSLGGSLLIVDQKELTSLGGLENLTEVDGSIIIQDNALLTSLQELINITSIDGNIDIENNPQLTSLSGLDNIPATDIRRLFLINSPQLSFCSLDNICSFISNDGETTISGNVGDCKSIASVTTSCNSNITPPLFMDYGWLNGLVNPNNCNGEKITEYTSSSGQVFVFVETPSSAILYVADGRTWCTNSPNYDCTNFYRPANTLRTWECGDAAPTDTDMDGVLSDSDPDDNDPCVPNNQTAACSNPPVAPVFLDDYPWLSDFVDFDNCTNEVITIYRTGIYEYLYIQSDATALGKLYNAAGLFYCTSSSNYDCVAAYNLTEVVDTWVCGDQLPATDADEDGIFSDIDPDDMNPCVPDSTTNACINDTGSTGTGESTVGNPPVFLSDYHWLSDLVVFENCSAEKITVYRSSGYIYLLVEGTQSSILYSATGQTYCTNTPTYDCQAFYTIDEEIAVWNCGDEGPAPVDNDMDGSFSDIDPDDNDPCVPDTTVNNCDTTMPTVGSDPPDFLDDYPWLSDLVDFETCTSDKITVYKSSGYVYLFVETPQQSILYNASGARYCTNSPTYDCQAFYSIDEVLSIWACGETEPIVIPIDGDGDGITDDIDPDDMDACVPDSTTALCLLDSGTLPPFFEQYPWLADVVNPFDCGNSKVTVYRSSGYVYLWVEGVGFPVLYNENGLRYCANSANYDCQEFYTVDELIEVWECENSFKENLDKDKTSFKISNAIHSYFNLFPNPTTGKTTLQVDKNISVLSGQIINLQGQVIRTIASQQATYTIDLEDQKAGVYIVQVVTDAGVISQKLIVDSTTTY